MRAYGDDLRAPIELNLQALSEAGDDELIRAVAHGGVAEALFRLRERLGESVEHARAAVVHARAIGNEALVGEGLGLQLLAEATLGREEAAATLAETWACQPASEGDRLLRQPKFHCAVAWMWQERVEETRSALTELIERGREIGDEASLPYILVIRAQADCLAGEFGTARSDAEEGYELAEQADQLSLQAYLLAVRALADAHAGNVERARDAGERALELAEGMSARPAQMFATTALGLLDLSVGQPEAAVARLEELLDFVRRERICEPGLTRFATRSGRGARRARALRRGRGSARLVRAQLHPSRQEGRARLLMALPWAARRGTGRDRRGPPRPGAGRRSARGITPAIRPGAHAARAGRRPAPGEAEGACSRHARLRRPGVRATRRVLVG